MLEGLEAIEVRFHTLKSVIDYRIESEYYDKRFLAVDTLLAATNTVYFSDIATFENGRPYNSDCFNTTSGISIAKIGDVTNRRDVDSWGLVDTNEFMYQNGRLLTKGDILMTLTGDPPDIGKVSYIFNNTNASWNQRVARIRLLHNQNTYNDTDVLFAILATESIRCQLERYAKGIRQRNLGNDGLERLLLPVIPDNLQVQIHNCIQRSSLYREQSKSLYASAEKYLLECLGLTDFAASPEKYNVKSLKDSFLETGRIDAEYYLPKYEDFYKLVESYPNGFDLLGNVCDIRDNNYTPVKGVEYKYIELANIGQSGEITDCDVQNGEDLPTRARRMVTSGDVIVSSIEGSLSSCAIIPEDYNGALCSTGFYVLRSSRFNPETLLTLFKSQVIQNLMKKGCSGTILTAISKTEIEKIPLPLIRPEIQNEIAQHVQKSFALRKEAMQLLEQAKMTVEQAIDNGGGITH